MNQVNLDDITFDKPSRPWLNTAQPTPRATSSRRQSQAPRRVEEDPKGTAVPVYKIAGTVVSNHNLLTFAARAMGQDASTLDIGSKPKAIRLLRQAAAQTNVFGRVLDAMLDEIGRCTVYGIFIIHQPALQRLMPIYHAGLEIGTERSHTLPKNDRVPRSVPMAPFERREKLSYGNVLMPVPVGSTWPQDTAQLGEREAFLDTCLADINGDGHEQRPQLEIVSEPLRDTRTDERGRAENVHDKVLEQANELAASIGMSFANISDLPWWAEAQLGLTTQGKTFETSVLLKLRRIGLSSFGDDHVTKVLWKTSRVAWFTPSMEDKKYYEPMPRLDLSTTPQPGSINLKQADKAVTDMNPTDGFFWLVEKKMKEEGLADTDENFIAYAYTELAKERAKLECSGQEHHLIWYARRGRERYRQLLTIARRTEHEGQELMAMLRRFNPELLIMLEHLLADLSNKHANLEAMRKQCNKIQAQGLRLDSHIVARLGAEPWPST